MLQNTRDLYGSRIAASDGDIGTVKDFYFDDRHWMIRYVVADTGSWLPGRRVLLSPHSFRQFDAHGMMLHVNLDRKQIQNSPAIETHLPLSREYEVEFFHYYGFPAYWPAAVAKDYGRNAVVGPDSPTQAGRHPQGGHATDRHLQSTKAVTGFTIRALDGELGQVSGLFVDDRDWSVPALVVETGHWFAEKEILISAKNVDRISYADSSVFVNLPKEDIRKTADTEVAKAALCKNRRMIFHD